MLQPDIFPGCNKELLPRTIKSGNAVEMFPGAFFISQVEAPYFPQEVNDQVNFDLELAKVIPSQAPLIFRGACSHITIYLKKLQRLQSGGVKSLFDQR